MIRKLVYTVVIILAAVMGYFLQTTTLLTMQEPLPENGQALMKHFQSVKKDAVTVVKEDCGSESHYLSGARQCCSVYYFDLSGKYLCNHTGSGLGESGGDCGERFSSNKGCTSTLLWPKEQ